MQGPYYHYDEPMAVAAPQSGTKAERLRQNSGGSMKQVFSWNSASAETKTKQDPATMKAAGVRGRPQPNSNVNFFSGEIDAKFNEGVGEAAVKRTMAEFPVNQRTSSNTDVKRRATVNRDATFNFFTGEAK